MLFPELRSALRDLRDSWSSEPTTLGLKDVLIEGDASSYPRAGFYKLAAGYAGDEPSMAGGVVNENVAMTHSVIWACHRIISESVAFCPLNMMQVRNGSREPAREHPAYMALKNAPNDEMSSMTFRETLTAHCVGLGNCYARIIRRSGSNEAFQFEPLDPHGVTPDRDSNKRLVYVVDGDRTYTVQPRKPHDILHIRGLGWDGIKGYSVIGMARHAIGTAQALERYAARNFATGGRQPGYIELAAPFKTKQQEQEARADLDKTYQNPENYHKVPLFPPGMKFIPYSWSPEDTQFLETRAWTVPELCRWFLISPHLVGDLSHATFSNIEHLALQFVKMTLTAWFNRWEQDLWRCVLTPEEKGRGYYWNHNVNGLLRGDFQTRMQGYSVALQNGFLSIDEVRDLEDRNALQGGAGKSHHIQLNMQTVPGTGEPTTSEKVQLAKLDAQADPQKLLP